MVSSKFHVSSMVSPTLFSSVRFLLACLSCCTNSSDVSLDQSVMQKMDEMRKSLERIYSKPPQFGYNMNKSKINQEIKVGMMCSDCVLCD